MRSLSLFLSLSLLLAACSAPTATVAPTITVPAGTAAPGVTASPAATAAATTVATTLSATPTAPAAAPSATPSAAPVTVGYARGASASLDVLPEVQAVAQGWGWAVQQVPGPGAEGLTTMAQAGAQIIVADGPELEAATRAAAGAFPKTYFIGVNQAGQGDTPGSGVPNLLTLGAGPAREDQLGFMAGVMAGYATRAKVVTVVGYTTDAIGRKYRNGFLHGVRFSCPRCRVDFVDLTDLNDSATAAAKARLNASLSSDVVFVAAGPASAEALKAAAGAGAWVLGIDADIFQTVFGAGSVKGSGKVVASAYFDPAQAVVAALKAYQAGQPWTGSRPYSAATGAIVLEPIRVSTDVLGDVDRADINAVLAALADGSLETGIDTATGDEL